jgi:hypothetical protein
MLLFMGLAAVVDNRLIDVWPTCSTYFMSSSLRNHVASLRASYRLCRLKWPPFSVKVYRPHFFRLAYRLLHGRLSGRDADMTSQAKPRL